MAEKIDDLRCIFAFANNGQVLFSSDNLLEPFSYKDMIVYNQYTNHVIFRSGHCCSCMCRDARSNWAIEKPRIYIMKQPEVTGDNKDTKITDEPLRFLFSSGSSFFGITFL